MLPSLYEQLERDLPTARHARLSEEQGEREIAELRAELARFELDLAIIKLKRAFHRKYRPNQPRVPAGHPHGGRWAGADTGGGGGREETRLAQYSMGTLVAELPYPGGRNCVYKFEFGSVVIPGPMNLSCPKVLPSAAVTHGILLNDN